MNRKNGARGFSLVELLAVVLVISALAAIAIPLYTSQHKSSQARVCTANIAAISASLSAYALRQGAYPLTQAQLATAWVAASNTGGLIGAPEGMAAIPTCPFGDPYTYSVTAGAATITCPNAATHAGYGPGPWTLTLPAPATDSVP